jgi:hypothetical protein
MKHCSNCDTTKEFTEFYTNKHKASGYHCYCKVCSKEKNKQWKTNNKEKAAKYDAAWQEKNKDKKAKNYKNWQVNNRDKVNSYNSYRRALELQATPSWLTKEQLNQIESFYWLARLEKERTDDVYHVDHIVPLNGKTVCGLHVPWNLQVLTAVKNLQKSNNI